MNTAYETTKNGIDSFWLKIIAIAGMTLDHIGIVMGEYLPFPVKCFLFAFGGLTFPIMAYLLCEGYRHTRSVKKYALRLLGFAVITQLPYSWALMTQFNVLFTLLLGLLAIHLTQKINNRILSALVVFFFTAVSLFCDWALMGVPMVLCCYYIKDHRRKVIVPVLIALGVMLLFLIPQLLASPLQALPELLYALVGCTLTIPLLSRYNGRRGRPMKYFFYAYYPIHLAFLGLLRGLIFSEWNPFF